MHAPLGKSAGETFAKAAPGKGKVLSIVDFENPRNGVEEMFREYAGEAVARSPYDKDRDAEKRELLTKMENFFWN